MPTRKPLHGMEPEKYEAKYAAHPRREYEARLMANDEARRDRGRERLKRRKLEAATAAK
jgi:hypothetical protein